MTCLFNFTAVLTNPLLSNLYYHFVWLATYNLPIHTCMSIHWSVFLSIKCPFIILRVILELNTNSVS